VPPGTTEAATPPAPQPGISGVELARRLWTGAFRGLISTHSLADPGYPFGSVVPFCLDAGGLPILLLSPLAQHSRNLAADPRCALTVHDAEADDVQRSARLTCPADCSPLPAEDAAAARRYLRYFPHTRGYFESLGFRFYRLVPRRFHFNGGFATARWLGTERVLAARGFDELTESDLVEHVERRHPRTLHTCWRAGTHDEVRVAGIDPWGLDLGRGERLQRLHFQQPIATVSDVDASLRSLT
jgi:hypothetical protein